MAIIAPVKAVQAMAIGEVMKRDEEAAAVFALLGWGGGLGRHRRLGDGRARPESRRPPSEPARCRRGAAGAAIGFGRLRHCDAVLAIRWGGRAIPCSRNRSVDFAVNRYDASTQRQCQTGISRVSGCEARPLDRSSARCLPGTETASSRRLSDSENRRASGLVELSSRSTGWMMPFSVTMPAIRRAGVTSNAGL